MSAATIDHLELRIKGEGTCAGGQHPDPPLDKYPLLAWTKAHPRFGSMIVHTEDQMASVHDVATAFAGTPSVAAVATRFGTTEDHVRQAIDYAVACQFLG